MKRNIIVISLILLHSISALCEQSMKNTTNSIKPIQSFNAPQAIGPYSQAIKVSHVKETLFISGQLPINPQTGELLADPAQATEQCMKNLAAILEEAEMDFSNVVETTILLKSMDDFSVVNNVYASFLQQPYPARLTFQAAELPKGACIEIKMIAVK
jgi:2-iminobutanoate/2-iminopropanoate deaminase